MIVVHFANSSSTRLRRRRIAELEACVQREKGNKLKPLQKCT